MKNFFVSYNQADRSWAEWIAWQLEQEGYTTVLQAWDFRPGFNFVLEMDKAAKEAERLIAVLSPHYLDARFTQPEWAAAFKKDPTGEKGALLPVRVKVCDVEGLLGQVIYIDLVGLDEAAARDALLAGVKPGRGKPDIPPVFPGSGRLITERPRFPGALPPVWNVPHNQNPHFTGREALLADLRAALTSGRPAALVQAIHGLGGVGKTRLAVEYAYRHAADYRAVLWVRAEQPAILAEEYACLASHLDLPDKGALDQAALIRAVRGWLDRNSGWLLVFDNAGDPADVYGYLPQGKTGHVLITSRNPNWGEVVGRPLQVPVLTLPEAAEFLMRRTGERDERAAIALAEELGRLPLALAQAGAYIEEERMSLAEYLQRFRVRRQELFMGGRPPVDYNATVTTTWNISLEEMSPAGAALMNLCAFLAPDDIPSSFLSQIAGYLPEAATLINRSALEKASASLRRYSLVDVQRDSLSVHRLVQDVVRTRMDDSMKRKWVGIVVQVLSDAFRFDKNEMSSWPGCSCLLPHAFAATGHSETLEVALEQTSQILNETGSYLHARALFPEAREAFSRALKIGETAYGLNDPKVAVLLNNLGNAHQDLGDLVKAQEHYERALMINEAVYGPDHPKVATDVNNLGSVLQALCDLEGARALYTRALEIDEAAHGPNHSKVAIRENNLGSVIHALGDFSAARAHYERALKIDEALYGKEHPEVARDLSNLGTVLQALGDFEGALVQYERALEIDERVYGKEHPKVATDVNNLGTLLQSLGNLKGARVHYERALKIDEVVYGPNHPKVATEVNNLGTVLQSQGDLKGALAYYERALKIDEAAYGPDHPKVARDVNNLGSALKALSKIEGARDHYMRALRIDESVYGPNHPKVASDVNNLGTVLQALGDIEGARAHYDRALKIDEAIYGKEHPEVARDVSNLGTVLQALGDIEGARAHYDRALKIDEAVYGKDHPKVASDVNNLGTVLQAMGNLDGARAHYERALKIDEAAYGSEHPDVARDVSNLGTVLQALGDFEAAWAYYERALKIDQEVYGAFHPKVAIRVNNLGAILNMIGKNKWAHAYFECTYRILRDILGEDHPRTVIARKNMDINCRN